MLHEDQERRLIQRRVDQSGFELQPDVEERVFGDLELCMFFFSDVVFDGKMTYVFYEVH